MIELEQKLKSTNLDVYNLYLKYPNCHGNVDTLIVLIETIKIVEAKVEEARKEGYDEGCAEYNNSGYEDGYDAGYDNGYDNGKSEAEETKI